jgi:zinc transporter 2
MSVGVIIASVVIYFMPTWTIVDPICTFIFSIIIIFTSVPVLKSCIGILMEGSPDEFDVEKLENDIIDLPGVDELHDLHVWSITAGKLALSCHIISQTPLKTLHEVTDLCRDKYKLYHTTI